MKLQVFLIRWAVNVCTLICMYSKLTKKKKIQEVTAANNVSNIITFNTEAQSLQKSSMFLTTAGVSDKIIEKKKKQLLFWLCSYIFYNISNTLSMSSTLQYIPCNIFIIT